MNILNVSLYCILLYSATPSTSFQNSQHTYLFKNTILIKNLGVNRLAVTQGVLHPMRSPPPYSISWASFCFLLPKGLTSTQNNVPIREWIHSIG